MESTLRDKQSGFRVKTGGVCSSLASHGAEERGTLPFRKRPGSCATDCRGATWFSRGYQDVLELGRSVLRAKLKTRKNKKKTDNVTHSNIFTSEDFCKRLHVYLLLYTLFRTQLDHTTNSFKKSTADTQFDRAKPPVPSRGARSAQGANAPSIDGTPR